MKDTHFIPESVVVVDLSTTLVSSRATTERESHLSVQTPLMVTTRKPKCDGEKIHVNVPRPKLTSCEILPENPFEHCDTYCMWQMGREKENYDPKKGYSGPPLCPRRAKPLVCGGGPVAFSHLGFSVA
jgi:hypothetical protein